MKKPYNPILGEFHRAFWHLQDNHWGVYIAEQVSHHPPISVYFYHASDSGVIIEGEFAPKSKFLGNSIVSLMEGRTVLYSKNRTDERYFITYPNAYARGILFGKMFIELGDQARINCPETGYLAEIDFHVKVKTSSKGIF